MSKPDPEEPTAERLVFFTDAVAAIALTLLVLPLVETVTGESSEHPLGELVHEHLAQLGAFVLSFAVIFRFWWAHHRIFHHVANLRTSLVLWSGMWTFGIVLLPIPTAIITAYSPSPASVAMYGGTLVLTSGSMTMLSLLVYRHPEVSNNRPRAPREQVLGTTTVFVVQLLATLIGVIFAHTVNYWAFLLMFLTGPVERLVKARWRHRESEASRT